MAGIISLSVVQAQLLRDIQDALAPVIESRGIEPAKADYHGQIIGAEHFPESAELSKKHHSFPTIAFNAILRVIRAQSLIIAGLEWDIKNLRDSIDSTNHYSKGERFDHTNCPSDACLTNEFVDTQIAESLGIEPKGAVRIQREWAEQKQREAEAKALAERNAKLKAEYEQKQRQIEQARIRAEREASEQQERERRLRAEYERALAAGDLLPVLD